MKPLRRAVSCVLVAAWVLAGAAPQVHASDAPIVLSPQEARAAAVKAMQAGHLAFSRDLVTALLQRDPDDPDTLLLLAAVESRLGNERATRAAARAAFHASDTPAERFRSARHMALALYEQGAPTRAQIWLRRASQTAPDDRSEAQVRRDFRAVRSTNPLSLSLDFAVQPSSNINNGSKSDTVEIAGLPFLLSGDARALSGIEYRFGLAATFRPEPRGRARPRIGVNLTSRSYTLSAEAKALAPDQNGADYAFQAAELLFGTTLVGKKPGDSTDLTLTLGQNWYAGSVLSQYVRAQAGHRFALANGDALTLSGLAERQLRKDQALRNATVLGVTGQWQRKLEGGGRFGADLSLGNTNSASKATGHWSVTGGLNYGLAKPLMGARIDLWADLKASTYHQPYLGPDVRQDTRARLGATLMFDTLQMYGFAPTLNMSYSRNWSNKGLYETEQLGVTIGIRSTF